MELAPLPRRKITFEAERWPQPHNEPLEEGMSEGIHFTFAAEHLDWLLEKLDRWFEDREEITLIAQGISTKSKRAFIVMEWYECSIEPLFLSLLKHEEIIDDFSVYTREEVYE